MSDELISGCFGGDVHSRIPRMLHKQQFCEKHNRWYFHSCIDCDQESLDALGVPSLYGTVSKQANPVVPSQADVAGEQPMPKGRGKDVAAILREKLASPYLQSHIRTEIAPPFSDTHPDEVLCRVLESLLVATFAVRIIQHPDFDRDRTTEVLADYEARIAMGAKKYGERLTTFNGRSALLDLYQELLDACGYATQEIDERTFPQR